MNGAIILEYVLIMIDLREICKTETKQTEYLTNLKSITKYIP